MQIPAMAATAAAQLSAMMLALLLRPGPRAVYAAHPVVAAVVLAAVTRTAGDVAPGASFWAIRLRIPQAVPARWCRRSARRNANRMSQPSAAQPPGWNPSGFLGRPGNLGELLRRERIQSGEHLVDGDRLLLTLGIGGLARREAIFTL